MGKLSKTFFYHNKRTIQVRQSPHSLRQDPGRNGAGRKDHATGVEGAGTIRVATFWMSIQRQITEARRRLPPPVCAVFRPISRSTGCKPIYRIFGSMPKRNFVNHDDLKGTGRPSRGPVRQSARRPEGYHHPS
jgi:hypothetical protein